VIIEGRYNGPPASGNGGWTAGTIAAAMDPGLGIVVTLRVPPPLATPLTVVRTPAGIAVYAPDGTSVADASPTEVIRQPIEAVSYDDAVGVSADYPGFVAHPFPTCFVCGPAREPGDGMRLFTGRLADDRTATPWTVPPDVSATMTWASLDCPGGWSVGIEARPYVLGRIAAHIEAVPTAGSRCVVMGRLLNIQGRKANVATTLHGPDGTAIAWSLSTWIAIA
jgi:hypothetical protein